MPQPHGDPGPPPDDGLQQERTVLAWRRTGLALAVAALLIARLTVQALGPVAVVLGILCAVAAAWVVLTTLRRGRFSRTSSVDSAFDAVLHDGRAPAALAAIAAVVCSVEVIAMLLT
jgi:uncharacterized membrane protein YidH (DUF202 family)